MKLPLVARGVAEDGGWSLLVHSLLDPSLNIGATAKTAGYNDMLMHLVKTCLCNMKGKLTGQPVPRILS